MKLLFALGNPGDTYTNTRHNVGFLMLDRLAKDTSLSWREQSRFKAYTAEYQSNGEKIILVKPTTYYNNVGESFRALVDFYKIEATDVAILHDDLALPFGMVRSRAGGSGGGSNGIKSLNAHGGDGTHRIRIGVENELRARMNDDASFVLANFTKDENEKLQTVYDHVCERIAAHINGTFEATSSTVLN